MMSDSVKLKRSFSPYTLVSFPKTMVLYRKDGSKFKTGIPSDNEEYEVN
jgi:hypothetical protein